MDYDRRRLLLSGSALVGSMLAPGGLAATHDSSPHAELASRARALGHQDPLRILVPQGGEGNVQPVAELFSRLSGLDVRLQSVPVDSIVTNMLLAHSAGDVNYDLALPATFGLANLAESGAILPLDQYRLAHEPAIIPEGALYSLGDQYDGHFYGYQTDGDVYLMFYNRGFLDASTLARYEDFFGKRFALPSSWSELDTQIRFFHRPDRDRFGGLLFRTPDYLVWEFWLRLHAKGVLPLGEDLQSNLASDAAVETLEDMISVTGALHPSCFSNGLVDNWEAYAQGNIYANIGWGGSQKFFHKPDSILRDKLYNAPTPGMNKGRTTVPVSYFNWGWNYTVPVESSSPELSYLFMAFAACPEPSTLAVSDSDGFFDPFREEHYEAPQIIASYGREFLKAHRAAMRDCIPDFYVQGQAQYFSELRKYLNAAIQGRLDPRRALSAADSGWQAITDSLGEDKLARQWRYLKKSYPRTYLSHVV